MPSLVRTALLLAATASTALATTSSMKPAALRIDSLVNPIGIDSAQPSFSWQLRDSRAGARETAYQIEVFSKPPASLTAKPDVWDSDKITAPNSIGIAYTGPALAPSTRYFWRVRVWDKDGKPYPTSEAAWWETGLMSEGAWKAAWIGYESDELHAVRNSGARWIEPEFPGTRSRPPGDTQDTHNFYRFHFELDRPIVRAVLYTTGDDAASAWIDGRQVIAAQPLPPWSNMPWEMYVRQDVTDAVTTGANLLAIEVTRYATPSDKANKRELAATNAANACLYVVYKDGTTAVLTSVSPGWKASYLASEGWNQTSKDDSTWRPTRIHLFPNGESIRPLPTGPVAGLRHSFMLRKPIVSARLYATALGAYELHINGSKVGDQVLAPGWTDYREQVVYQTYDVTKQLHPGANAIAALLAPGWYSTPLRWIKEGNNYGATQPALRAQLRIAYADGSVDWIATDDSWKATLSPILLAELYDGQTEDARLAQPGWDTAAFADAKWHAAELVQPVQPHIVAQYFQPITHERTLTAKSIHQPKPGVYILDFGQNMSAQPILRVHGPRGEDVQLRFGEVLNPDGTLYTENLRSAKATDHYILAGSAGAETFAPQFTFHGFRYAEITGLKSAPTLETLKAAVLHTDAAFTSQLTTGDKMINQLWSNILWGQRSNFVGVPTDCPQRDERLGWSADAQVFWRTAAFNMDLAAFSRKFSTDLRGTQQETPMYGIYAPGLDRANDGFGAAWSDAGIIIPWTSWIQTGDTRVIDQNWDGMMRYIEAIGRDNPNHLWQKNYGNAYGDWLTPTIRTPEDLLATAYWAYDVDLLHQMALATGRTADAAKLADLFHQIRDAFQKAYVHSNSMVAGPDRHRSNEPPTMHPTVNAESDRLVETQTGYVLALHMDLVPANLRAAAAQRLVTLIQQNHWLLGTGFLGTPYLLEVLSDTGHSDVAYQLLLNRDYPSWGYLIDHGATTMWERWNGDQMRNDPSMNSYNHYAYGAVGEWIYRYAAGIDTLPTAAGFRTIYLHPNFGARLGKLDFTYDSTYGPIHSAWHFTGKDTVSWQVTIPPNTTAVLDPAATNATSFRLTSAPLVDSIAHESAGSRYNLTAGTYTFTATVKPLQP